MIMEYYYTWFTAAWKHVFYLMLTLPQKRKNKLPNSNQLILIIVHQPFSSNNQATIEMIPQIKIIPESIAGIYQYLKKCILFNHSKLESHLLVAGKRL